MRSNIDTALNAFVGQLYSQHRRSAFPGPRGGAIVSDPKTVDLILKDTDRFQKAYGLLQLLGQSRFSTDGANWQWRRDLTQSHYVRAARAENGAKIAAIYKRRLASCSNCEPTTITRALLAASTEIFHEAFGCTVATEPMLSFFDRARALLRRLQYFSLTPPTAQEHCTLEQEACQLIDQYIVEINSSPALREVVGRLQAQGWLHSDDFKAAEELMMNYFAAVETTTATLSFAIDRLGAYQAAQADLAAEITRGGPAPRIECFINETMRYFPPIPILVRRLASDAQIENLMLAAGSVIIASVIGVHHHPDYWNKANVFDPERREFLNNTYDRRAFIPFASGVRSCGGARLARLELIEGLRAFIQRFVVNRQGEEMTFDYAMAMRPNSWNHVTIIER